jgi:hypothetical protein
MKNRKIKKIKQNAPQQVSQNKKKQDDESIYLCIILWCTFFEEGWPIWPGRGIPYFPHCGVLIGMTLFFWTNVPFQDMVSTKILSDPHNFFMRTNETK